VDCRAKKNLNINGDIATTQSREGLGHTAVPTNGKTVVSEVASEHSTHRHSHNDQGRGEMKRILRVIKFGGTSVGDACCIEKVVEIIRAASHEAELVVVVSAMSGVTNQLVEAASESETGNEKAVTEIFKQLRQQHEAALNALIRDPKEQNRLRQKMDQLFEEGYRFCQDTILLGELTLRVRDAISSLGERLSVPLVAATLKERGVASEAIEATELIVTNSYHGAADPWLDLTRERCEARLLPLLEQRIVPVITGFIGATADGILTTLGRGGSDYSAAILGGVLDANEVVIWTDVDGLLTADPRLVPDACTIPDISYREAAELAFFGAKVLHPKTLRPLVQRGISLRIRNTFSPETAGTRITPTGAANGSDVTALTAVSDAALITVGGPEIAAVPDLLGRTIATTRELRADVLLISQSSSQNDICLVVPSSLARRTLDELRREFAQELTYEKVEHIVLDATVAIVTVVGQKIRGISGIVGRTFDALGRLNVEIVAIAHGASGSNISFVVAKKDMQTALAAMHREFRLNNLGSHVHPAENLRRPSHSVNYQPEFPGISAD